MRSSRRNAVALVAILGLTVVGFLVDIQTRQGITDWVWYFIPLLLTAFVSSRLFPFVMAAVLSVLTLSGYYLSPKGIEPGVSFINASMGVFVLWLAALLLFFRRKGELALLESEGDYLSLFENMLNGFAFCRMHFDGDRPLDFTYLKVNPAFETLTGLKNVQGRKATEVIPGVPRLAKPSDLNAEQSPLAVIRGGNETILLVEDDARLRASVHKALSQLGYRVLEAINGVEALGIWKQHSAEIHLVLTDLVMPGGINGRELGERLLKENRKSKVIYASGYSAGVTDNGIPLVEGVNFLTKPFQAQKLAQTIRLNLDAEIEPV